MIWTYGLNHLSCTLMPVCVDTFPDFWSSDIWWLTTSWVISRRSRVNDAWRCYGMRNRQSSSLLLYPPIPYSHTSKYRINIGVMNNVLLIDTTWIVASFSYCRHSWRYCQWNLWRRWDPNFLYHSSIICSQFIKYLLIGMMWVAWFSLTSSNPSLNI